MWLLGSLAGFILLWWLLRPLACRCRRPPK